MVVWMALRMVVGGKDFGMDGGKVGKYNLHQHISTQSNLSLCWGGGEATQLVCFP